MAAHYTILPNEGELFSFAATGNQLAFTAIFDHYSPRIFAFILKMTKSQHAAEDITQEIFIKLWTNREKLPEVKNYRSYIFTMAFNLTITYVKRVSWEAGKLKVIKDRSSDQSNITEESIVFNESYLLIQKAVSMLSPQRKTIYKLNREQGLTLEQIAVQLNISRNTARNHLAEAIRSIKEYISQHATAIGTILFVREIMNH